MADFSPAELLELFQRAQAQFTDRVDAVEPDQWDDEALPGWTVGDLVAHLVTEMLWVAPLLAGEPFAEGRFPDDTDDLLGDDPFTGWESAADAALSAFAEDDALVRTVHLTRGPTPAAEYILELTADLTVHAWDLARADRRRHRAGRRAGHRRAAWSASSCPRTASRACSTPPLDVSARPPPRSRGCSPGSAAGRSERWTARPGGRRTPPTSTRRCSTSSSRSRPAG